MTTEEEAIEYATNALASVRNRVAGGYPAVATMSTSVYQRLQEFSSTPKVVEFFQFLTEHGGSVRQRPDLPDMRKPSG